MNRCALQKADSIIGYVQALISASAALKRASACAEEHLTTPALRIIPVYMILSLL